MKPDWKLDGVNLLPYLEGKNTAAPHETLYWRFGEQMAIRQGDWKLVRYDPAADGEAKGKAERRRSSCTTSPRTSASERPVRQAARQAEGAGNALAKVERPAGEAALGWGKEGKSAG